MDLLENKDIILKEDSLLILDDKKIPFAREYFEIGDLNDLYDLYENGRIYGNVKVPVIFSYGFYYEILNGDYKSIGEVENSFIKNKEYILNIFPHNQNLNFSLGLLENIFKKDFKDFESFRFELLKLSKGIEEYYIGSYGKIGGYLGDIFHDKNIFHMGFSGYEEYLYKKVNNWVYIKEMGKDSIGSRNLLYKLRQANKNVVLARDFNLANLFRYGDMGCLLINPLRICKNGDLIGTSDTYESVVLAMAHGIKVYCLSPKSLFDVGVKNGLFFVGENTIEEGSLKFSDGTIENLPIFNPKYSLINKEFIEGFISEDGIIKGPFEEKIVKALGD